VLLETVLPTLLLTRLPLVSLAVDAIVPEVLGLFPRWLLPAPPLIIVPEVPGRLPDPLIRGPGGLWCGGLGEN
jgi:hypothetical protein